MFILNEDHKFKLSISVNKKISKEVFEKLKEKHFNYQNETVLVKGDFMNDYILIQTDVKNVSNTYFLVNMLIDQHS